MQEIIIGLLTVAAFIIAFPIVLLLGFKYIDWLFDKFGNKF